MDRNAIKRRHVCDTSVIDHLAREMLQPKPEPACESARNWGSSAVSVQVDERCGSNAHIGRIRFVFRDLFCFHARYCHWSRLA